MATKKTIHELAKEFPNKTYIELEKYRDADRNEEAQRIITQQENEELKEDQLDKTQDKVKQLQDELDRVKKENNDLYNRISKLTDPTHALKKARESGL